MTDDLPASPPGPPASLRSRRALPPFAALRAFDAVARLGGIRKAAEALAVDHAAVSRHLRTLEDWTGVALVVRDGRAVTLTNEGRRYYLQVSAAIDAIASATLGLARPPDDCRLHIWCMPGFAFQWLMARLDNFHEAYPGLDVEIKPSDTLPDFLAREADVHIHYAPTYGHQVRLPASVRSVAFASPTVFPVASPEYLARSKPIREPRDLLDHVLIQEGDFENWRAWLTRLGVHDVPEAPGPRLWHGHLTMDAARRGHGITLSSHFLAYDDLAKGKVVEVTGADGPFPRVLSGSYLLVSAPERWDAPPVARFRRWLTSLANAELKAGGPEEPPDDASAG